MDHNKVVRLSLKYLNIAFGVLMIVVLSLSLESIQHSRRLTNVHEVVLLKNLRTSSLDEETAVAPDRVKVLQCQSCNNDALKIITIFNACSAGLSTILAIFSFLLAFANRFYAKHKLLFSQGFIGTTIAAIALLICSVIAKSPRSCNNDLGKECDSDFAYHFDYKIIPTSVMMLATIPQLLFKSIGILYMHFVKNENDFCRSLWSFPYKPKRHVSNDNYYEEYHSKRNSQAFEDMSFQRLNPRDSLRRQRPIETVAEKVSPGPPKPPRIQFQTIENEYGFVTKIKEPKGAEIEMDLMETSYREMPIDCPTATISASASTNTIDTRDSIYETLPVSSSYANPYVFGNGHYETNEDFAARLADGGSAASIERRRQGISSDEESLDWQDIYNINQDGNNSSTYDQFGKVYNVPLGRKFTRKSSLSTIAEEKTMTTLSSSSNDQSNSTRLNKSLDTTTSGSMLDKSKTPQANERVLLENILNEFQDKNTFLNEVMHVFEPSSRDGTFNRNIPIRFSSPFKSKRPSAAAEVTASKSAPTNARNLNPLLSTSIEEEPPSSVASNTSHTSANNSWSSTSHAGTPHSHNRFVTPRQSTSPSLNSLSKSSLNSSPSSAVSALSLGCLKVAVANENAALSRRSLAAGSTHSLGTSYAASDQRVSSMTRLCLDRNNLLLFQPNKKSPSDLNSLIVNALNAKKIRFVKRLKNRIETRRGRPLSQSLSVSPSSGRRWTKLNKSPSEPTREAMRDHHPKPKRALSSNLSNRRLDFRSLHDTESSYDEATPININNNNNYVLLSTSSLTHKQPATKIYENVDIVLNHTYESIGNSRNPLISSSSSTIGANRSSSSNMALPAATAADSTPTTNGGRETTFMNRAVRKANDLILVDKSVKPVYF